MDLQALVRETINRYGLLSAGDTVIVGISGGVDSVCLLALFRELAPEYGVQLHAAHLNHGLRPEAAEEAAYVEALCSAWCVPCTVASIDVRARSAAEGRSLEEAARQARYALFGRLARELGGTSVAVGHHANDQAETVLMHLLRGAGLSGLAGMRPASWLDDALQVSDGVPSQERIRLIRPLLYVTRTQLEDYARAHHLEPVVDASNMDRSFLRNRVRHDLLPQLESYNPGIREALCRMAEAAAGEMQLAEAATDEAWAVTALLALPDRVIFDRHRLEQVPAPLQRALIRRGVLRVRGSLRDLSWAQVDAATEFLRRGHTGGRVSLGGGLVFALGYDRALLGTEDAAWPVEDRPRLDRRVEFVPGESIALPGGRWRVRSAYLEETSLPADWRSLGPYHAWLDVDCLQDPLEMRPRRPGDRLSPLGMVGTQSVKEIMINSHVPAQEREAVPVLTAAGRVVWVVGLRLDRHYAISLNTTRVLHVWFEEQSVGTSTA